MTTNYKDFFAVDPYPYKRGLEVRVEEDSIFLQDKLAMTQDEIKEASQSYTGNEDGLRNFIFITRNYFYLKDYELTEKATSLPVAIMIFAIDAIMYHIQEVPRPKKDRKGNKIKKKKDIHEFRLAKFLRECFKKEDKLLLLNAFSFSATSVKNIPMGHRITRHLMYKKLIMDWGSDYKTDWCTCVESQENIHCKCIEWLCSKDLKIQNHYLTQLAHHLYKMRCAIVHDGIAPSICHTEKKPEEFAIWSMIISDLYMNNRYSLHYRYESALSRAKLEEMFTEGLRTAFRRGYPKR